MRDVVIRGFGQIELAKGLESSAPRVLVSGSSVRDFKIKELVGAFINADSKIQMAALDASGELAGTMVVQNGLPVNRQLAGVLDKTITDSRKIFWWMRRRFLWRRSGWSSRTPRLRQCPPSLLGQTRFC